LRTPTCWPWWTVAWCLRTLDASAGRQLSRASAAAADVYNSVRASFCTLLVCACVGLGCEVVCTEVVILRMRSALSNARNMLLRSHALLISRTLSVATCSGVSFTWQVHRFTNIKHRRPAMLARSFKKSVLFSAWQTARAAHTSDEPRSAPRTGQIAASNGSPHTFCERTKCRRSSMDDNNTR